jgi:hypothetical protein
MLTFISAVVFPFRFAPLGVTSRTYAHFLCAQQPPSSFFHFSLSTVQLLPQIWGAHAQAELPGAGL